MDKEEINSLVIKYQHSLCQKVFSQIYHHYYKDWLKRARWDASYANVGEDDIISEYGLVLNRTVMRYNPSKGDFEHMLARSLLNARRTLRRDNLSRTINEQLARTEEEAATFLEIEDESALWDFISSEKTKEQRELLSHLVSKADDLTCKVLNLYLVIDSYRAVGKRLGIEHKRVKRIVREVAHGFDGNRFGDYRDYLYA